MKTQAEIVTRALRRLGVAALDTPPSADEMATGTDVLSGLLDELASTHGMTFAWAASEVPNEYFLPLAYLLAVDMAPEFEIAPRDSRAAMIGRLRSIQFADDRADSRDLNDDYAISDAEASIGQRAVYY